MEIRYKITWKDLPWYLKAAVIIAGIDAFFMIVSFLSGFIEGVLMGL